MFLCVYGVCVYVCVCRQVSSEEGEMEARELGSLCSLKLVLKLVSISEVVVVAFLILFFLKINAFVS